MEQTAVFVYKDQNGTRIISNYLLVKSSLRLIKRYTPETTIRAISGYRKTTRNLIPRATKYDERIFELADEYNQDRSLIKAIIQIESSFNPRAISPKGAQGLMQLLPSTAQSYNVNDPYDVKQNLRGGIHYFSDMMLRYNNNILLALAAYNAGQSAVSKYNGIPPYPETQAYVKNILRLHKNYQTFKDIYLRS